MLFKNIAAQVQDIDALEGLVTIVGGALGNEDADGDVIERGSYAKSITERGPAGSNRIKFLWQHDPWEPIGRPLWLREDSGGPGPDGGLVAQMKVAPTQRGRDALILYQEGVITEHSVGIDVLRRDESDRRRIKEVRLWEISAVTWGANPLTPLLSMKAATGRSAWQYVASHISNMKGALKEPLSDEMARTLELALSVLEGHLEALEKALTQAPTDGDPKSPPAPPNGTQDDGAPQSEAEWLHLLVNQL